MSVGAIYIAAIVGRLAHTCRSYGGAIVVQERARDVERTRFRSGKRVRVPGVTPVAGEDLRCVIGDMRTSFLNRDAKRVYLTRRGGAAVYWKIPDERKNKKKKSRLFRGDCAIRDIRAYLQYCCSINSRVTPQ